MQFEKMEIEGAWLAHSPSFADSRGTFHEWFKSTEIEKVIGDTFSVAQANISISAKGAIRGIHYSLAPQGQRKWITCVSGSIWDVIVDIRPTSPTFKKWIGVQLNSSSGRSVYLSEGLGHGFISLEENSAVSYLLSSPYSPDEEYGVNPFDLELNISWPILPALLSEKDARAKSLGELSHSGKLPN
jgi:dTDP-4-dehydrorhamnose 3,5-epimerase